MDVTIRLETESVNFSKLSMPNWFWKSAISLSISSSAEHEVYESLKSLFSSKLSKFNSPKGKSSLQAEIFIDNKVKITNDYIESVKKNTIENLVRIGIFKKKDLEVVNVKFLKYANVIFDKNCSKNRTLIFDYFKKYNVDFVGRFGKWAYLWSDDCFLAGKLTAEKIYKNLNEINIKR